MDPHSRKESARRWLRRWATIAGCASIPAAIAVLSIESRASPLYSYPINKYGGLYRFRVNGVGNEAKVNWINAERRVAAGEHCILIAVDRYPSGFPYPWRCDYAYLASWEYPPPPADVPLPDIAKLDQAVMHALMPWAITRVVDPSSVRLRDREGSPNAGQRVLGGFDAAGALANVSLLVLALSLLGCAFCIYTLVRQRVVDAVIAYMTAMGFTPEQRRMLAVKKGLCPGCGYAVDYPAQVRCPECGLDLAEVVRLGGG